MPKVHNADGTCKIPAELQDLYTEPGLDTKESMVTYCRLGDRSSIEWFCYTKSWISSPYRITTDRGSNGRT